eukprot:s369_g10.t1
MVMELVVLSKEPLVVNRFHATRPMTGEMEATTMPMLLDIGLRSQAADKAWGLLGVRLGGVAGCGSECTTGSSSTRPPRAKAGDDANQVAMVAQVLKLRLGNEHNFCYGNAMLHGLLALSLRVGGPEGFFPPLLCSILSGALSQGRVFHIWTNPFWRALVRGWPRPESQHDIAEFLQYLVGQCPGLADKIGVVWASIDEASGEHLDGGCFVPLYLHPPTCALGSGAEATTVQQMLDCWHRQETVHAVLQCPPGFVLQVPTTTTIGEPVYLPPITAPAEGAPQTISAMPPQGAVFAAPAAAVPTTTTIGEPVYLPPVTAPAEGAPQTIGTMPPQGAVFAAPTQVPTTTTIGEPVYLPPVTAPAEAAPQTMGAMPPQGAIFAAPASQATMMTTIGDPVYLPPITAPAQGAAQMAPGTIYGAPPTQGAAQMAPGTIYGAPPTQGAVFAAPGMAPPGAVFAAPAQAGGYFAAPMTQAPMTQVPGTAGATGADMFTMMDTNHDGVVSREEFARALQPQSPLSRPRLSEGLHGRMQRCDNLETAVLAQLARGLNRRARASAHEMHCGSELLAFPESSSLFYLSTWPQPSVLIL